MRQNQGLPGGLVLAQHDGRPIRNVLEPLHPVTQSAGCLEPPDIEEGPSHDHPVADTVGEYECSHGNWRKEECEQNLPQREEGGTQGGRVRFPPLRPRSPAEASARLTSPAESKKGPARGRRKPGPGDFPIPSHCLRGSDPGAPWAGDSSTAAHPGQLDMGTWMRRGGCRRRSAPWDADRERDIRAIIGSSMGMTERSAVSTLSVRLSPELDSHLSEESSIANEPKSLLARRALEEFLKRRRRERFVSELARAAAAIDGDEAAAFAAEALPLDNEALAMVESACTTRDLSKERDGRWGE